jgi:hypothetical protein
MNPAQAPDPQYDDEINLAPLFQILYRRKKFILYGTLLAAGLSLLVALVLPRVYRSEGFYAFTSQRAGSEKDRDRDREKDRDRDRDNYKDRTLRISTVAVPDYKKYQKRFTNPLLFQNFIKRKGLLNQEDLTMVSKAIQSSEDLNKLISPAYAYAKDDLKVLAGIPPDTQNYVVGVQLNWEAKGPDKARALVVILGVFLRNTIMYNLLYDYINSNYTVFSNDIRKFENDNLTTKFNLEQLSLKADRIKTILKRYPSGGSAENRQVVSVGEGGYNYLSPATQLVGVESQVADLMEKSAKENRNKEICQVNYNFFNEARKFFGKDENGDLVYNNLVELQNQFFKNLDLNKDTNREVYNALLNDMEVFRYTFYESYRFVSEPNLPLKPVKPKKALIVTITTILAFFVFLFLAFIIEWWKNNKSFIKGSGSLGL